MIPPPAPASPLMRASDIILTGKGSYLERESGMCLVLVLFLERERKGGK